MAQPSSFRAKALSKTEPLVIRLPDRSHERAPIERGPQAEAKSEPRLSMRKRIAVLLAAIAVPAMAAPGDFGAEPAAAPAEAISFEAAFAGKPAMPFERPGMSFPGSAFYYLADPPTEALVALPSIDPLDDSGESSEVGELIDAGPAAKAFFLVGTGISKARAQECLAQAVWYEAASESDAGHRAVAQVVLNRVAHPSWPKSVCGVVYEGSSRSTGCQFSFTCDGSLARRAGGASWQRAQRIAAEALEGSVYAPIGYATHYHTLWVDPYWAGSLEHVGTIGAHRFYRNRGAAGSKSTFTGAYAGNEPNVRVRTAPLPDLPTPQAIVSTGASVSETRPVAGPGAAKPDRAAAPLLVEATPYSSSVTDPALGTAGQVKAPYANAGQWKTDPGELDLSIDSPLPGASQ
ncbi:MAG: cell wall hydrolase [Pseudomonadota bacterium]